MRMNKRIFLLAILSVIAADLILWAVLRLSPAAQNDGLLSSMLQTGLSILGFPVRLYVIFVLGENGSWGVFGLPILILLLLTSGLLWGFFIERAYGLFKGGRSSTL